MSAITDYKAIRRATFAFPAERPQNTVMVYDVICDERVSPSEFERRTKARAQQLSAFTAPESDPA